jgi:hypothetical protein
MIQYNVTVIIEPDVHDEWLKWMKESHIPDVLETGCFIENKFARLLSPNDGNLTYSIQYTCNSITEFENYQNNFAPALQKDHTSRFEGKFVAFRTVLQIEQHSKK